MEWFVWINAGVWCLILVAFAGSRVMDAIGERRRIVYRDKTRVDLMNASWWFSEDLPTMKVIQKLADGVRVDEVREEWRRARAQAEGGED